MTKVMVYNFKSEKYESATPEQASDLLGLIESMNEDCAAQQSFAPDVAKYCHQCGNKYDGVLCGECGFTMRRR
jgi:hypothetical protein